MDTKILTPVSLDHIQSWTKKMLYKTKLGLFPEIKDDLTLNLLISKQDGELAWVSSFLPTVTLE